MTRRYEVEVERSGGWWSLTFPGLTYVYSQTRRLDQAEAAARRAIGLKLDIPPETIEVHLNVRLPGDIERARATVAERRVVAERAQRDASDAMRGLVQSLAGQGYSVRDIGEIVGLSPQRVSQLTTLGAPSEPGSHPRRVAAAGK